MPDICVMAGRVLDVSITAFPTASLPTPEKKDPTALANRPQKLAWAVTVKQASPFSSSIPLAPHFTVE